MDERIKKLLPSHVDLCPIEWDTLKYNKDVLSSAFANRSLDAFYSSLFMYDTESALDGYISELLYEMKENGIPKDVFEKNAVEVIDWLYDHDESDPVNEMFEKALPMCCYVQLLYEDYRTLDEFASALGVDSSVFDGFNLDQYVTDGDDRIFSGLRIYFMCNPKEFVECRKVRLDGKFWVFLWDSCNGCGEETEVELHLTIDDPLFNVDYTDNDCTSACGLVDGWAANDGIINPIK